MRAGHSLLSDGSAGSLSEDQQAVAHILVRNSLQLQKLIEELLNPPER